jgi:hypothetical protein
MKGKKTKALNADFYAGGGSNVAKESKSTAEGFKRGGKAKKVEMMGEKAEKHAGRKPRMSGGKVMSSAASGTPRGKSSHY